MLLEHNFSISKRGLFYHAISLLICFADYSHVQTVSKTEEVHIKFAPSTPDIVCVVFSKFDI